MEDEATGGIQKSYETRPSFWDYARRVISRIYLVVGGIANCLGIYTFGESHHWWEFTFALSPEMTETLLMLAVGLGGPWAMILGGIAGAKFSELFTRDKTATASIAHSLIDVGFFFAILHCSQMSFGLRIFSRYLSSEGFVKVVVIYLFLGLAVGVVGQLAMRARSRKRAYSRG